MNGSFLILAFTLIYAGFMFWCLRGWRSISASGKKTNNPSMNVDVVIAIRDEERTIKKLLAAVVIQNYSKSNFRIIVVDDHSTDNSFQIARDFLTLHPEISSVVLHGEGVGKKLALAQAIKNSNSDLILTTDGDCEVTEGWIRAMVEPFYNSEISFVAGPVILSGGNGLFSVLQKMEMTGLTGIAGASIINHRAMMCNGANLCYRKSAYDAVQGFAGASHSSGDDTQLMRKIQSENPAKLSFVKSKNAIVKSNSLSDLQSFWQQRRRWATKIPFTLSFFTVFIAVVSWLVHTGLFIFLIAVLFAPNYALILLAATVVKVGAELVFLKKVSKDLDSPFLSLSMILIQPIYWMYIMLIGITVPFAKYEWKGRKVK